LSLQKEAKSSVHHKELRRKKVVSSMHVANAGDKPKSITTDRQFFSQCKQSPPFGLPADARMG